ncbi:hypothetical protein PAPYR_10885 [Paratrimastix pyriformis]|uniref:Uncharacterized protein n=1 Tax=Paratrimastix pyriformis TaxID=342808 RepID=A0ABQ8U506_9EUKA|nr:hypothetical protein PAPYR_10885 [Paratrimastix pyriformis]
MGPAVAAEPAWRRIQRAPLGVRGAGRRHWGDDSPQLEAVKSAISKWEGTDWAVALVGKGPREQLVVMLAEVLQCSPLPHYGEVLDRAFTAADPELWGKLLPSCSGCNPVLTRLHHGPPRPRPCWYACPGCVASTRVGSNPVFTCPCPNCGACACAWAWGPPACAPGGTGACAYAGTQTCAEAVAVACASSCARPPRPQDPCIFVGVCEALAGILEAVLPDHPSQTPQTIRAVEGDLIWGPHRRFVWLSLGLPGPAGQERARGIGPETAD